MGSNVSVRLAANRSVDQGISDILSDHLISLAEQHLGNNAHTLHRISWTERVDDDNYGVLALCSIGPVCALVDHQVSGGEMSPPKITVFRTADVRTVIEENSGVWVYVEPHQKPFRLPSNTRATDVLSMR